MLTPLLIFCGTYLILAIGGLPGLRIDRTGAAIIGAALMIGFNVLSIEQAYAAIDYDTIILLFGMMIVVANLRLSGFFRRASAWVVEHAHRPLVLLAAIVAISGFFSALFVNDTMCLVLTPLVLEVTLASETQPGTVPAGCGNGSQCRQRGDDHGKPAKYDDRQLLPHPLCRFRGRSGSHCGHRAPAHRRRNRGWSMEGLPGEGRVEDRASAGANATGC